MKYEFQIITQLINKQSRVLDVGCGDGGLCLLYTSPSPRDVEEYRMPSSA